MAGLAFKQIPLLINGGIDTKTNPKLVRAPGLLELENLYQLRTGEMRVRNGCSVQLAPQNITSADNLFNTQNGGLASISGGWLGLVSYPQAMRYGTSVPGFEGWSPNKDQATAPHPMITARVTGSPGGGQTVAGALADAVDPDLCLASGLRHLAWGDGSTTASYADLRELDTGRLDVVSGTMATGLMIPSTIAGRPPRVASTGGSYAAIFFASGGNNLKAQAYNPTLSLFNPAVVALAADLDGALPWFDAKAIPGTNTFAVAYKVNGGGIKCGIFDPAAGTFASVVATVAADASFCLGWMDDQLSSGQMWLVTAGSGAGVIVRQFSATTMTLNGTITVDATATANIRNVTGHLTGGTPTFVVLWDVAGSVPSFDAVKKGTWNGSAATVATLAANHSLYSRTWRFPNGSYYVLGCFSSTPQPTFGLFSVDTISAAAGGAPQCHVLSGEAGGRRLVCSLASPVTSGATVVIPAARARSITTPSGAAAAQRKTVALLTFSIMTKITHAREMGATVFVPGGMLNRDDGATFEPATFPIYPETPTGTSAAGGAMTASGAYLYRIVFRATDAAGRVYRSAGSVPFAITLGAGDGTVNLAVFNLQAARGDTANGSQLNGYGLVVAEVYRRGPAASGSTNYNKVNEIRMSPGSGDTLGVSDTMSDANAALGELAYFTGNTNENFHPPSSRLLEVNGNRVGLVSAEEPTEFWFSKEYKPGTGIAFNPLQKVSVTGDGFGALTALAAMDGRWILFKSGAIYVMSGVGPNDLGQGQFNEPQAISRTVGCSNPSSVLETPDGIMFQASTGGIWLLGRGLDVQYVGSPVEAYALAEQVTGAALASGLTTARFVMPSGRMLEWDYFHKRWYAHQLRVSRGGVASTVVDCANSPLFGWCYMLANGDLMKEIAGQATDVNSTTLSIVPRLSFPHLDMAGLGGYQRFKGIDFVLDVVGNHTVSVDAEYDYSGALTGTPKKEALTTATPTAIVQYLPPEGRAKCTSVRPVVTIFGTALNGSFRLTGATLMVAVKRGSIVPASNRLT